MKFFDSSVYLGPWPSNAETFPDVNSLVNTLDRLNIHSALVNHTLAWQHNPHYGNCLLMDEIREHPQLEACWGLTPGPALESYDGLPGLEKALVQNKIRAIRLFPKDHVIALNQWMTGDFFDLLNKLHLVVFLDADQVFVQVGRYDYDANRFSAIKEICQSYPHIALVINRTGYRPYQSLVQLMQQCNNLYLDLSYLATHQGVEDIVQKFGSERLLFGTSLPFVEAGGALTRLIYAGIPEEAKQDIAGQNLENLLQKAKTSPLYQNRKDDQAAKVNNQMPKHSYHVIDAHGHMGPYFKFHIPQNDSDGMIRAMDAAGVEIACISSHLAISGDWKRGNLETLAAVRKHQTRLKGHVVINPNHPLDIKFELNRFILDEGFIAIKIIPDTHLKSVLDRDYEPMWQFAAEHKVMVLSHTFHGSPYDDPQLFAEIAERHPEVNVLIVHSGALIEGFEGAIRLAQKYSNLYLDISGSFITSHWIERLINEAGDEKVVYSSDLPFIDIRYGLGKVLYSQLSEYQKSRLLRDNIIQITKRIEA
jgi:uncharacterized protein